MQTYWIQTSRVCTNHLHAPKKWKDIHPVSGVAQKGWTKKLDIQQCQHINNRHKHFRATKLLQNSGKKGDEQFLMKIWIQDRRSTKNEKAINWLKLKKHLIAMIYVDLSQPRVQDTLHASGKNWDFRISNNSTKMKQKIYRSCNKQYATDAYFTLKTYCSNKATTNLILELTKLTTKC